MARKHLVWADGPTPQRWFEVEAESPNAAIAEYKRQYQDRGKIPHVGAVPEPIDLREGGEATILVHPLDGKPYKLVMVRGGNESGNLSCR